MTTNINNSDSRKNLKSLVEFLKPILSKYGFEYEASHNGYSSSGQFSNGFFTSEKIKIGLIFRSDKLGSVNYETNATNISHDMLFRALNRVSDMTLFYDKDKFNSFTLNGEDIHNAFVTDLENVVIPYIKAASIQDINKMMLRERKNMWK